MKFLYTFFLCSLVSSSFLQSANSDQQKNKTNNLLVPFVYAGLFCGLYGLNLYLACDQESDDPFASEGLCQAFTKVRDVLLLGSVFVGSYIATSGFPAYKNSDKIIKS